MIRTNITLSEINKHPRDNRIEFHSKPHLYFIDGSTKGYVSATTLIHSYFKKFDADVVIEKMMASANWPNSKYYGMEKADIKKMWAENGKESSVAGNKLHLDIENFYNNLAYQNDSKEFLQFLQFYKDHYYLQPYRTEWMVFAEQVKIAGSIDMLFLDKEGDFHIYDWKRAKAITKENRFQKGLYPFSHLDDCNFWHYALQLNLYRKILKINYGIDVKSLFLVQLHPLYDTYMKFECPIMEKEIDIIFNDRKDLDETIL